MLHQDIVTPAFVSDSSLFWTSTSLGQHVYLLAATKFANALINPYCNVLRLSPENPGPGKAAADKPGTAQRPSLSPGESGRTKQSRAGQPYCNVLRVLPRVQVQTKQPRASRVPQRPSLSPRESGQTKQPVRAGYCTVSPCRHSAGCDGPIAALCASKRVNPPKTHPHD